ncbi:MAG: photosystem II protein Psb27 [Cyanobium sp. SAT1300]|nr:photosystem II protein Psb27 [Cyanobium sp. SAT1300]|tara:strand:+ start:1286 stop:1711 length:426 start_codon:yes stop_codon:yes gene_type:complete
MLSALARLFKPLSRAAVALGLGLCLLLTACSDDADGRLTGNYADDTISVAQTLLEVIDIPQDDPSHAQAESDARSLITDYMSRYRPQPRVNGLSSFTTMQTALNSLAGHYANYSNRPLPEALHDRLAKELTKAEKAVVRGT